MACNGGCGCPVFSNLLTVRENALLFTLLGAECKVSLTPRGICNILPSFSLCSHFLLLVIPPYLSSFSHVSELLMASEDSLISLLFSTQPYCCHMYTPLSIYLDSEARMFNLALDSRILDLR